MNKMILTIALLSSFTITANATPSISITNEVQPVEVIAHYDNTTFDSNTLVYKVGNNIKNQARISFVKNEQNDENSKCFISYISESGAFNFLQEINEPVVCDHINRSLKHTFRTEGCPVTFSVDTTNKVVESVVSACDFRASLETNPII